GDAADAISVDDQDELVRLQIQQGGFALGNGQSPGKTTAKPVNGMYGAFRRTELLHKTQPRPAELLLADVLVIEVLPGHIQRNERWRSEHDRRTIPPIASHVALQVLGRPHGHRHLVLLRDRPRLDPRMLYELA